MTTLDLSATVQSRQKAEYRCEDLATIQQAVEVVDWRGHVLPGANVLGAAVYPVVEFTGALERMRTGEGPQRCLTTLEMWEAWGTELLHVPPRPLQIIGFVSVTANWYRALRDILAVAGLGAGMLLRHQAITDIQLLDADATHTWVVQAHGASPVSLRLPGRIGPVPTATRVPATRLMEEGLFAHALLCGAIPDGSSDTLPVK